MATRSYNRFPRYAKTCCTDYLGSDEIVALAFLFFGFQQDAVLVGVEHAETAATPRSGTIAGSAIRQQAIDQPGIHLHNNACGFKPICAGRIDTTGCACSDARAIRWLETGCQLCGKGPCPYRKLQGLSATGPPSPSDGYGRFQLHDRSPGSGFVGAYYQIIRRSCAGSGIWPDGLIAGCTFRRQLFTATVSSRASHPEGFSAASSRQYPTWLAGRPAHGSAPHSSVTCIPCHAEGRSLCHQPLSR